MLTQGTITNVGIAELKAAPWNPSIRIDDKAGIKALADSMNELGQLYPIMVTKTKEIVDGHRRVAAASYLGWQTVKALVADVDRSIAYGALGTTSRPFTGREALAIYVNGGPLAGRSSRQIVRLEELVGHSGLKRLCDQGFSASVIDVARAVVRYCGRDVKNKGTVRKALWWLAEHAQVNGARAVLDHKLLSPVAMWRKVEENQDLTLGKFAR